ncbi:hypothetical protein LU699_13035 [Luteimonas fraxinea]|uniref:PIN domain-containing protein n=1 Tax=Luteimonas fraxinea TaxID=2901869 RepID=A0ABS8UGH4_9GAMM|nr:hypothetical protein [Luteimonas fraxinea]MCD9098062.1 hypothetical protein [Luteimonas fraxinea]UHH09213.1 hypothetical protein LU699_13035 [Luteimonas fraxinea]
MNGYVLDACTLLNLYCAWGGIRNLHAYPVGFHLGTAAASEIHHVREYDSKGCVVDKRMSTTDIGRSYPLRLLSPTPVELDLTVHLARWLGDGEAQGLAIAASRGLFFCTDDGAVQKLLNKERLYAQLISTPELLKVWAGNDLTRLASLPTAVRRVRDLGKFTPNRSSPHLAWWAQQLDELPEDPQC